MKQYHDLPRSILQHGKEHHDRTEVGTISCFDYQTRLDLRDGLPIVTTEDVPFRWVAEELFRPEWFQNVQVNQEALLLGQANPSSRDEGDICIAKDPCLKD